MIENVLGGERWKVELIETIYLMQHIFVIYS